MQEGFQDYVSLTALVSKKNAFTTDKTFNAKDVIKWNQGLDNLKVYH